MNDANRTEALEAQIRALRESERRLAEAMALNERVIAASSVGITVLDASGQCVLANEAAARALGATPEQLLRQNVHRNESWRKSGMLQSAEEALATGETTTRNIHVVTTFGRNVWLNCRFIPFPSDGERRLMLMFDDITDRKHMEQALRESEERYRRQADELEVIYRSAPIGLAVFDRELRYLRVNDRLAEINGVPAEAHVGKTPREVVPTVADLAEELAQRILATGEAVLNVEFRGETRAQPGVERIWTEHWLPLKDEAGQVWGINVVVEEITARKRAGQALQESERRLRLITDALPVLISYVDSNERYQFANAAYERWFGIPRDQVIGHTVVEIIGKQAYDHVRDDVNRALAGERVHYLASMPYQRGGQRETETLLIPHKDERGNVLGIYLFVQDVSELMEHKRAEEALQTSERLLRTILEHLPVGVCLFDGEGRVIEDNPALKRIWGEARYVGIDRLHEFKAWWAESGTLVEPHAWAAARAVERGETVLNEVIDVEALDGARRTILNSAVPVRDSEGKIIGAVAVVQEITELQRTQRLLRETNQKLERSFAELRATEQQVLRSEKLAALGALAAGVAHELNNPLMGVMGYVWRAQRQVGDAEARSLLERADSELKRMRDILKNMLGFASPVEEEFSAVRPADVLERALALMRPGFKVHDIEVIKDLPPGLPVITAKAGALQQVFVNLLLNARDAVAGRPERRIRIAGRRDTDSVVMEVTDTGAGIPVSLQEKIFDPFYTTKRPGKGTGLGLSISRNILTDLGGALTVRSEEGKGATFTVVLPISHEQQSDA